MDNSLPLKLVVEAVAKLLERVTALSLLGCILNLLGIGILMPAVSVELLSGYQISAYSLLKTGYTPDDARYLLLIGFFTLVLDRLFKHAEQRNL